MPIHVGDVGVQLELAVTEAGAPVDLTGATQPELRLQDPAGRVEVRPAAIVAPNKLRYLTDTDDLTTEGQWQVRGHFTLGAWTGHTSVYRLTVSPVD